MAFLSWGQGVLPKFVKASAAPRSAKCASTDASSDNGEARRLRHFTEDEDAAILEGVERHGHGHWQQMRDWI